MPDFKVLRGSAVIASGQTALTLTEGTSFTLEPGIASEAWFFRITSNHFTGMGRTSGGGNQNVDDFTVSVGYSGNNVILRRYGGANNCRVDWEIVQYIGASGGPNEIIVRQTSQPSVASGAQTHSTALAGSVSDAGRVIPFITGQRSSYNSRSNVNRTLFTSNIVGSNVVLDRGTSGSSATVSFAVVEFTGSNWSITKQVNTARSGTNQTVSLSTALTDYTKAFIHPTYLYRTTGTVGLDDASERVRLTSNTQMNFWAATGTDAANKEHIVWIAENPDMTVNEYTGTMAGPGEEEIDDIAVAQVADVAQTSVMVSNDSTGAGTAFPRGFINATLLSDSTVRLRQSDNGQTSDYSILVIEWPEDTGGAGTTIDASTETLTITTNQAGVSVDRTIAGAMEPLVITTLQATIDVTADTEINAATEALTLTALPANISLDRALIANTESLTLTTQQADIRFDAGINAATESLTLTTLPASVTFDATVNASTEALTITTHAAAVNFSGSDVLNANAEALQIATLPAEIVTSAQTQIRRVGGDDAPSAREQFWRKQAEKWLEERIVEAPKVAKRSKKKRKAFVQAFLADASEILAKSPEFEPRIDHVKALVTQLDAPRPDYTALAQLAAKVQQEQALRARRERDLAAVLILAA